MVQPQVLDAILARQTTADEPGKESGQTADSGALDYAYWLLGYGDQWKEQQCTPGTALTLSAIWACVRLISQTIASLGWNLFEKSSDGKNRVPVEDDVAWILDMQASPEMSAFDFRQVMLKDSLTWGNAYAEIERDNFGRLKWLWRIAPERVDVDRLENGQLVYVVKNGTDNKPTVFLPDQIFHLKGLGPDGIVGYSVVEMARTTIDLARREEKFGARFFGRGPMPGGILTVPHGKKLDKEEREQYRNDFEKTYGGSENAGKVVVLSGGLEFTPLSLPNTDAQWIEGRAFSIVEVCRWYGVPPHKIADLSKSTNNNIEHQAIEFVQDCLLPWSRRLETEADIKLFGRVMRGRRFTKLNLATLLRGDSKAQTESVAGKVNAGLMTPDEGRAYFDLNPYDNGIGSEPLVQGAMTPLERVLEEPPEPVAPAPATPAQPAPAEPAKEDGTPPADLAEAFMPILSDAYARLLRVEGDKAKRAANKGKLAEHVAEFFGAANIEHVAAAIGPIHDAFQRVTGKVQPGFSRERAEAFNEARKRELSNGLPKNDDPKEWAEFCASEDLQRLKPTKPTALATIPAATSKPLARRRRQRVTVNVAAPITIQPPDILITNKIEPAQPAPPAAIHQDIVIVHPTVTEDEEFRRDARGLIVGKKVTRTLQGEA